MENVAVDLQSIEITNEMKGVHELTELQLGLVGGGIGDVVFG